MFRRARLVRRLLGAAIIARPTTGRLKSSSSVNLVQERLLTQLATRVQTVARHSRRRTLKFPVAALSFLLNHNRVSLGQRQHILLPTDLERVHISLTKDLLQGLESRRVFTLFTYKLLIGL